MHWPAFPEFAIAPNVSVCPTRLSRRQRRVGGLRSCPVEPFEEARRPQHKETRSVRALWTEEEVAVDSQILTRVSNLLASLGHT